jgi:zinc protease
MADLRRFFAGMVLLLLAASVLAQAPQKSVSIEGVTEWRLANGLKLLTIPDPAADTVTVHIVYLVGSRHEGYGEKGMAHLLEHLLFKGSKRHPNLKEEFTRRGGRWNGTTSNDRTNYFETLAATRENLEWAIAMEADRMVNSFVSKRDLDSEMTVVRNEFEMGENNPGGVLFQRMQQLAFPWHNYGNPIIGQRSDIEQVPIAKLQAFYRTWYQPDNAVLIIAGRSRRSTSGRCRGRSAPCPPTTPTSRPRTASAACGSSASATTRSSPRSTACRPAAIPTTRRSTCS